MNDDISKFLDNENRIKAWPSKGQKKLDILAYLATKFECGRVYNEKAVNSIINDWHTFGDYFLLRRELVDHKFLSRTRNGASYWKEEQSLEDDNE